MTVTVASYDVEERSELDWTVMPVPNVITALSRKFVPVSVIFFAVSPDCTEVGEIVNLSPDNGAMMAHRPSSGHLFIAQDTTNSVLRFTSAGAAAGSITSSGFGRVWSVTYHPKDDLLYAGSKDHGTVVVFTPGLTEVDRVNVGSGRVGTGGVVP